MSQYTRENPITAPWSGTEAAGDINAILDAMLSGNSGASRPPDAALGCLWVKSTVDPDIWEVMIYNGTDADIKMGEFDITTDIFTAVGSSDLVDDATPELGGNLDTNNHMIIESQGANVTAASSISFDGTGNFYIIDGDTNITGIANIGGAVAIEVYFTGAPLLSHHATNFRLPNDEDIQVRAGDRGWIRQIATGQYRLSFFQRGDGTALAGAPAFNHIITKSVTPLDAEMTFTEFNNTKYVDYQFVFRNFYGSLNGTQLQMRTSSTGGAPYDSAVNDYLKTNLLTGQNEMTLTAAIGNMVNKGFSGTVNLYDPAGANFTLVDLVGTIFDPSGRIQIEQGAGVRVSNDAVNAVWFSLSSIGTLTSGEVSMYGRLRQ